MKFLTRVNRSYIKYGLLVFLIADFVIIAMSNFIIKEEIDQQLYLESKGITETVKKHGDFRNIYPTDMVSSIGYLDVKKDILKDTLLYDVNEDEMLPYRELTTYKSIEGEHYKITTRQMLMEFDDLFLLYTTLISLVLLLIFVGLLLFTRRLNISLWKTFNTNIEKIKTYSFTPPSKLDLAETGINEFDELNEVLSMMSGRLEKDYTATKEFSANAAHELQTPLAIIRNKCENLFSDSDLNKKTIETIREIYLSADKLSGITKALLILAKIDNGQFNEKEMVSLNEIFKYWMNSFQDVIQDRKLDVSISAVDNCQILIDKRLANLLIQNIFVNSIKHSRNGDQISIFLAKDYFTIANMGEVAILQPGMIFNRFYTESPNIGSTGIGLAIVKKIADHYKIEIEYTFKDFKHLFTFNLKNC
ncbi:sensor histidine kinase [Labilibaculum antarcticum]|uniref:histidine kinase n=1 Tax=Labilibaculum antarcticum TaxID=1717717 RepID=A0A1Y1CIE4_9BACT|nr:HAMP domain-containing sensor histidine kinase [Labilibaculum antarcticum]BAX80095.1 two-component sensor histidine kinase [Labilibaculum antarcticum]